MNLDIVNYTFASRKQSTITYVLFQSADKGDKQSILFGALVPGFERIGLTEDVGQSGEGQARATDTVQGVKAKGKVCKEEWLIWHGVKSWAVGLYIVCQTCMSFLKCNPIFLTLHLFFPKQLKETLIPYCSDTCTLSFQACSHGEETSTGCRNWAITLTEIVSVVSAQTRE